MAVNFTNSPSDGATITADGRTYTFSSSTGKWDVTSSPGDTLLSLTDVGSDGTNGQVLTTNGSGSFTFTTVSSGGLSSLVEDTTPQLGGNLDMNSNDITGTGNIDVTGSITSDSNVVLTDASQPSSISGASILYAAATTGGGTGVHFVDGSTTGELVSKTKAIVFGLIF